MKRSTLLLRSLQFHRRANLGLLLGSALAASILAGALLVGDSARFSLGRIAELRLGNIHFFAGGSGRLFAGSLAGRLGPLLAAPVAPMLQLPGTAARDSHGPAAPATVNRMRILGVDAAFASLGGSFALSLKEDQVAISRRLADDLGVREGDELVLRAAKPALLSRDAPLSSRSQALSVRFLARVVRVLPDDELGSFSLEANQVPSRNAFVSLSWLQSRLDIRGRVNTLLIGQDTRKSLTPASIAAAVQSVWTLPDVGLAFRAPAEAADVQLESDRIFLDDVVVKAALAVDDKDPDFAPPLPTLAYLVTSISREKGGRTLSTPYSFVLAAGASANRTLSPVPAGMRDDQVVINRWLATELAAAPGDSVSVAFYELLPSGRFEEHSRRFSVHSIVEMESLAAERARMPDFPGLSDVESCSEWDIGMPTDEQRLKDKPNEDYWNRFRQTPKAFFTWKAGREMWANRFGNATAVRFSGRTEVGPIEAILKDSIQPALLGLGAVPVRRLADDAVKNATDLGGLFLGMSFFLLIAALLLTGLLFSFSVTRRSEEMGVLRALGFTRGQVRALFAAEAAVVAAVGSILGAVLGLAYARGLIWGVNHLWSGAVAGLQIPFHLEPASLAAGAMAGFITSLAAVLLASWRQLSHSPLRLLQFDFTQTVPRGARRRSFHLDVGLALLAALGAIGMVVQAGSSPAIDPAESFFGAGALLLIACMAALHFFLKPRSRPSVNAVPLGSVSGLAARDMRRRPARSITVAGLLASGCFLVLAVASMQTDPARNADQPGSATGGFALWAESTIPLPEDPGTPEGRRKLKISDTRWPGDLNLMSLKIHDGDDASCFNLNRAPAPRLIGVDPAALAARKAFLPPGSTGPLWELLARPLPDGSIPALAGDANTAMWGLQKKADPSAGDVLIYRDEQGRPLKVKLVGTLPMPLTIFQGALLISSARLVEAFPSDEGYRLFLADHAAASPAPQSDAGRNLAEALDRYGLDVQTTPQRLRDFHSVEKTYLAMFLVIGGLGLLLGTAGLAVVVFRNVMERRSELATLRAVGFPMVTIHVLLVLEHAGLLIAGVLGGVLASVVAAWPAFSLAGSGVSALCMATVGVGLLAAGLIWIALATLLATRGNILPALRND